MNTEVVNFGGPTVLHTFKIDACSKLEAFDHTYTHTRARASDCIRLLCIEGKKQKLRNIRVQNDTHINLPAASSSLSARMSDLQVRYRPGNSGGRKNK
jgi:hypothetical protein